MSKCGGCVNERPDANEIWRARATICHWCKYVEHTSDGPWTGTAVLCTISGKTVEEHVLSCRPSCPKCKHPRENGMVLWNGLIWFMGVPKFQRVQATGPMPGCGCIYRLKMLWLRFTAWVDTPPALRGKIRPGGGEWHQPKRGSWPATTRMRSC